MIASDLVLPFESDINNGKPQSRRIAVAPPISVAQADWLFYTKLVMAVLALLFGFGGLVAVLVLPAEFGLLLEITTTFRTGAAQPNGYPAIQPTVIGTLNVAVVLTLAGIMAFFGAVFVLALHGNEVAQMSLGVNPFIWVFMLIWHVPLLLGYALLAGVNDLFALILLGALVVALLREFWNADLLFAQRRRGGVVNTRHQQAAWPCLFILFVLLFVFILYLTIFVYLGFTFGAAEAPPPPLLSAAPVLGLVVYAMLLLLQAVYHADLWFGAIFWRDICAYALNGALLTVTIAIALFAFAFR